MARNHARDHSGARGSDKSILLAIADRANDQQDFTCFPGISTLAKDSGFSERTVKKAISNLVEAGEIEVLERGGFRGGRGMANLYRFTFKVQDSPIDKGRDLPEGKVEGADSVPLRANASPGNGQISQVNVQVSQVEGADLAPQPEVEPKVGTEVVNQKKEPVKESSLEEEDFDLGDSQFRHWLSYFKKWSGKGIEEEEPVRERFDALLARGYRHHHLLDALKGATEQEADDDLGQVELAPEVVLGEHVNTLIRRVSPRAKLPEAEVTA